jgi:hypothetical protein
MIGSSGSCPNSPGSKKTWPTHRHLSSQAILIEYAHRVIRIPAHKASPKVFSPEYLHICQHPSRQEEYGSILRDVQEAILVLVLLVDAAHQGSGGWQHLIDEDEDGLLWAQLNALADDIDELTDGQVSGH